MNTGSELDLVNSPQRNLPAVQAETATAAAAAQATALVQARYTIAIRNPRDLDVVREKLLKECRRPGFADVARYNKPIGDGIVGPSIRFAEAALRCMGNVVIDTLVTYDDREKRILQVCVTDLEANVPYTTSIALDKTVERKQPKQGDVIIRERLNSKNEKVFIIEATEDQLLNKQNNLISKAIRTNGLRLIPGDIVEECMDQVVVTQENRDAQDPDAARRKLFDSFTALGVTVAELKKWLGHDGATVTKKETTDLRALYTAIKDGETTWRAVMEAKFPSADAAKTSPLASMKTPGAEGGAK